MCTLIIIFIAIWSLKQLGKHSNARINGIAILSSIFALDLSLILKMSPWSTTDHKMVIGHSVRYIRPSSACTHKAISRQIRIQILLIGSSIVGYRFAFFLFLVIVADSNLCYGSVFFLVARMFGFIFVCFFFRLLLLVLLLLSSQPYIAITSVMINRGW